MADEGSTTGYGAAASVHTVEANSLKLALQSSQNTKYPVDRLSIMPLDVLRCIFRALEGSGLDKRGHRENTDPMVNNTHAYNGKPHPPFGALCCCNKSLCAVGNGVRKSVHIYSTDQVLVERYLVKLPQISCAFLRYPSYTQEIEIQSSLVALHGHHPKLTSISLHYEREQVIRRQVQANIGQQVLLWCPMLKCFAMHHICCGQFEDQSKTKFLNNDNGLGFISQLPCLCVLELHGTRLALNPRDLLCCSNLVELNLRGTCMVESNSLDVSGCSLLQVLICFECTLSALVVAGLAKLVVLNCRDNNLKVLDVTTCAALKRLNCTNNGLRLLDVKQNHALEALECRGNGMCNLDLSNCELMKSLICCNTSMNDLSLSACMSLQLLNCRRTRIRTEDLHLCSNIACVHISDNWSDTTSLLTLPSFRSLTSLFIETSSGITSIDVTDCTALQHLDLLRNPALTSLHTSGCHSLQGMNLVKCGVRSLDMTGCSSITYFKCTECSNLAMLDLSSCLNLRKIWCRGSLIESLDVSSAAATLETLSCSGSPHLTQIYVTGCSMLSSLDCSECVQLKCLACIGCINLKVLKSKNAGAFDRFKSRQLQVLLT